MPWLLLRSYEAPRCFVFHTAYYLSCSLGAVVQVKFLIVSRTWHMPTFCLTTNKKKVKIDRRGYSRIQGKPAKNCFDYLTFFHIFCKIVVKKSTFLDAESGSRQDCTNTKYICWKLHHHVQWCYFRYCNLVFSISH